MGFRIPLGRSKSPDQNEPRVYGRANDWEEEIEAANFEMFRSRNRAGCDPVPRRLPQETATPAATTATAAGRAHRLTRR